MIGVNGKKNRFISMKKLWAALALSALSVNVMAHSPFTAPTNYIVYGNNTSMLAGFAEHPFDTEVAIRGFDFKVVDPKQETIPLLLSHTASLSSANIETKIDGTYQIIGERQAAIAYAKIGKRWLRVLDAKGTKLVPLDMRDFVTPSELTAKQQKMEVQRIDQVISFFSKYKPSDLHRDIAKSGLQLSFSAHPNTIQAGQVFSLTVQLDQKAAVGYQVHVEHQQTDANANDESVKLTTDAAGKVTLPLHLAGQYRVTVTSPQQPVTIQPAALTYRSILSLNVNP